MVFPRPSTPSRGVGGTTAPAALPARVAGREALLEFVRALNTTLEPATVAAVILERAATWVALPSWAVVSSDLAGQLSVLGDRGVTPEMVPAVRAIAASVMSGSAEFVSSDSRADGRLPRGSSAVAFALVSRGRRIGALVGLGPTAASRGVRPAPGLLAGIRELLEPAAAALDSALLVKRAEALSVTDDLTGLYNARYLRLVLRREMKRAARSGRALTLLFIDLDGFKSVNDAYGHLCGSRALVEAAAVIRGSAREYDVVARFGGDEFALVLPDTSRAGGLAVGERVRARLAGHAFLAGEGLDIHLTASVGVATAPDEAASSDDLVQAADRAMYRVKGAGKNGIQTAAPPADT